MLGWVRMTSAEQTAKTRARIVSAVLLAIGFASAVAIYVVNGPASDPTEYELENSKKYLRAMETYGGKANLLASDLRHWFSSLWHGRTLAFTVAILTVIVTLIYRLAVMPLPPDDDVEDRGGDDGRGA
jgi:hypothetical protein